MLLLKGIYRSYSTTLPTVPLLINGGKVLNKTKYKVFSPTDEHLHNVSAISEITIGQVDEVCESSYNGFQKWSLVPQTDKYYIYSRIEEEMMLAKDDLIKAHLDIGVPDWFANFNFQGSMDQLKHYKSLLISKDQGSLPVQNYSSESRFDLSLVLKQPIGPVLSIVPWNAPGILTMRAILAPLTAGCSVVLKSSHLSPLVSYIISDAFIRAGLPKGALQMINSRSEDSELLTNSLIANKSIRKINFTGSTRVGSHISEVAGKYLKPTLMELGGKNVSILCSDLDDTLLESAITTSLWAGWCHKGQICMCTDSIYIHESIYDKAIEMLKNISSTFLLNDKDLLINQRTVDHGETIRSTVEDAISKGANIEAGTFDPNGSSSSMSPIVLSNIDKSMDIYHNEVFGPVVSIIKYTDIDGTVNDINASGFGLKCSLWTGNQLDGYKIARGIESGSIHINHPTVFDDPHLPHGGVKNSGHGKFNGDWGIDEFTYSKLITMS